MSANTVRRYRWVRWTRSGSSCCLRVVDGLEPSVAAVALGFRRRCRARAWRRCALAAAVDGQRRPGVAPRQGRTDARLTIVYGSQTGNGKRIAERLGRNAEAAGLAARVYAAGAYPLKDLAKERMLVIVMSTHGDGDPPDDARGFIEFLAIASRAEARAVVVRGACARRLELPALLRDRTPGATSGWRISAPSDCSTVVDCDVDYEQLATPWLEQVVTGARDALGAQRRSPRSRGCARSPAEPQFSRENPFPAEVLANQRLTARDATKDVRHIEIALDGSGLTYEPGDALGVWHENPPEVVDEVLEAARLDGAAGGRIRRSVTHAARMAARTIARSRA